jgi:hypothetical protein
MSTGGSGGLGLGGAGGMALDGPVGSGGSLDSGAGGSIDVGGGETASGTGGVGGGIDAPGTGAGGAIDSGVGGAGGLGLDGAIIDVPIVDTAGAGGGIDSGLDIPLGGVGDGTATGGAARTGGRTGTGGARTGGATGTGGATTPDAGPDVQPDTSTLGNGLVAYYKCDETSGTTLADSSGNNHHGTLAIGAPADGGVAPSGAGYNFAAGRIGNALTLTRAGYGYASLPPAVFNGITDITVAAWVWVTSSGDWQRVFDVGVKPTSYLFVNGRTGTKYMNLTPRNSSGNLRWSITGDGWGSEESLNTSSLATGEWKHVAVVLTGGNGFLYIDGVQAVTDPTVLTPAGLGTLDYAYLGRSPFDADPYFDGAIDEFRVYNRALSAAEVSALYQFAGP